MNRSKKYAIKNFILSAMESGDTDLEILSMIEHRNEKGQLHRVDGPAVEWPDGTREWWVNGQLHRVDGPAIVRANGTRAWFVDGKFIKWETQND